MEANPTLPLPMKIGDKFYFQESYVVFFLKGYIIHILPVLWHVLLDIDEDFFAAQ